MQEGHYTQHYASRTLLPNPSQNQLFPNQTSSPAATPLPPTTHNLIHLPLSFALHTRRTRQNLLFCPNILNIYTLHTRSEGNIFRKTPVKTGKVSSAASLLLTQRESPDTIPRPRCSAQHISENHRRSCDACNVAAPHVGMSSRRSGLRGWVYLDFLVLPGQRGRNVCVCEGRGEG
jgi:hypothetical protein